MMPLQRASTLQTPAKQSGASSALRLVEQANEINQLKGPRKAVRRFERIETACVGHHPSLTGMPRKAVRRFERIETWNRTMYCMDAPGPRKAVRRFERIET